MNNYFPESYELVFDEKLDDVNGIGMVIRHKKTNARLALIENDDDNKVFYIGFRTPPKNNTGVAHILEHSVLCGSRKFPSKEPFVELIKGSLNTFLNAMTYSDKTVYPVASCNDKDFQNLIDVYLDAVFYPNIYEKKEIFLQEGWHYHLEDIKDEIIYNGVVYNEMKGVFSSPEEQLFRTIQNSLYPDTTYGVESGGYPDDIPDLSYEEFLEFHKSYYHPSNSYIYLYGDMDFYEKLDWLDKEYLSKFDYLEIDSQIEMQEPFNEVKEIYEDYALGDNEDIKDNTYLSFNTVIGDALDKELLLAFQILEYVLLSTPGAPIKEALINKKIGKDILSSFQGEMLQPMFSIIAKNTNEYDKEEFISTIKTELKKIIKNGIDKRSLKAAINYYEFRYLEADYGAYPKGLIYGLSALGSWLYDDEKPFLFLHGSKDFEKIKTKIETRYFEDLIEKYILNNKHSSIIILKPKKELLNEIESQIKNDLFLYKNNLSDKQILGIVDNTINLKTYQEEPSQKEDLDKIPLLKREDITEKVQAFINEEKEIQGVKVIHHSIHTNAIAYIRFLFDISYIPQELIPYLSILSNVLGIIDTKSYKYLDLSNEININTGGIYTDVKSFAVKGSTHEFKPVFEFSSKVLYDKIPEALRLIKEIMFNTKLDNNKRIEDILNEIKSKIEMKFISAGHAVAVDRAMSYYSEHGLFKEQLSGIDFYNKIKEILNKFDENKKDLVEKLQEIIDIIFKRDSLIISITSDYDGYVEFEKVLPEFITSLNNDKLDLNKLNNKYNQIKLYPKQLNEGFKISSQVQYVARVGNLFDSGEKYTGALKVLKVILSYEYLWNNVRVKGGAYGCMNGFSGIDGDAYFVSYRDPKLKETNEIYEGVPNYISSFKADEREITKYIIGTISGLDTPLTPQMQGRRSFNSYMVGITIDDLKRERQEIINITNDDINKLAILVESILKSGNICVVGNESKIERDKDLFNQIKHLI